MPRVAPETAVEHPSSIGGGGLETTKLLIANRFDCEAGNQHHGPGDVTKAQRCVCAVGGDRQHRKGDEPDERRLQPEHDEQAAPPERLSVSTPDRRVSAILPR